MADGAADPLADVRSRHEEHERFIAKNSGPLLMDEEMLRSCWRVEEDRRRLLAALDAERAARERAEAAITRARAVPEWDARGPARSRAAGRSGPRHHPRLDDDGCWYFVLDIQHDPIARQALACYAEAAAAAGYGVLADDLQRRLAEPSR